VFTGEAAVEVRAMTLDNIDGNTGKISLGLELVRTRIIIEAELARIARAHSRSPAPRRCSVADQLYIYRWDRHGRKGQLCTCPVRGTMNSCLVVFADGYRMVTSRNALRRADG
jgi:hypothetical protein